MPMMVVVVVFVMFAWVGLILSFGARYYTLRRRASALASSAPPWCSVPIDWYVCRCGHFAEYHEGTDGVERLRFYKDRETHSRVCGTVML